MNKTIVGCLAAIVLLTSGCAEMAARREAAEKAQRDEHDRQLEAYRNAPPEVQAQIRRDVYAREFCSNQATMASVTTPGINSLYAGVATQASCLDFYNRTGHLPGQAF